MAKLDTKVRKFLTVYKMHHPKSDVDRLYLPRMEGGTGGLQLELSYKSTTIGLDKYLQETQDTLLHFVTTGTSCTLSTDIIWLCNIFP